MKTCLKNCWAWMFIAIAIAVPAVASAQSICEGLTTILTADDDELEFYTVPGAICKYDGVGWTDRFGCIWQKPGPSGRGKKMTDWLNTTIYPDMKKLAGAIQQCIKQDAIPFEWGSFEEERHDGILFRYFVQEDDNARELTTISVCFEYDSDEVGAGVVLTVEDSADGESHCISHWPY